MSTTLAFAMNEQSTTDRLDHILERWRTSRPDVDFSSLEVGTRVLRAAHYLHARLDRIAAAYGLSHRGDLETLTELDLVGPLTPTELAEDLLLTSGGMTVRLNRLQAAGLVERRPNPRDGRGVLIHLTPAGRDIAEDALASLLQAQSEIVGLLEPSERSDLTRLLRTLLTGLGDAPPFSPTITVRREER
ncbi:MAG TPA: MarR family transcriptional regulator [Acidimicrobiia bacterium]|nr:MarR family transcriptional regulator [Acidimicrobiia bacterium]